MKGIFKKKSINKSSFFNIGYFGRIIKKKGIHVLQSKKYKDKDIWRLYLDIDIIEDKRYYNYLIKVIKKSLVSKNLYKNKYSHELLNLIPKFFCKSTSRILINDMMESDVITRHRYCLPI